MVSRRKLWCKAINIDIKSLKENDVICETHFSPEMFSISINKTLNSWAVPKNEAVQLFLDNKLNSSPCDSIDYDINYDDSPSLPINNEVNQISLQIQCVPTSQLFVCEICNEKFLTRDKRNKHIDDHFKTYNCVDCGQSFIGDRQYGHHKQNRQCQPKHKDAIDNRTYECFECHQASFFSMRSLRIHQNRNHFNKLNTKQKVKRCHCEFCKKTFATVYILRAHIEEIHNTPKQHICDLCGKQFNRLSNMKIHRLIHENKMPCKCQFCGKSFRTTSGVNLHKRMHTGEKPHKCDICNLKAYSYSTDLKRHKRSAHGIVNRVFPCSMCKRDFYEPKFLRAHMQKAHPSCNL